MLGRLEYQAFRLKLNENETRFKALKSFLVNVCRRGCLKTRQQFFAKNAPNATASRPPKKLAKT